MTLEVREYGINLAHLEPGDCYRTLLTDRVGTLREKLHWGHRVEWRDIWVPFLRGCRSRRIG